MGLGILYPRFDHPAIEEQYASWQAQLQFRRSGGHLYFYDPAERARDVVADVEESHVLVITDPLLLAAPDLGTRLTRALVETGAWAAVPVTNQPSESDQQGARRPYMTLREFENVIEETDSIDPATAAVTWKEHDPGAYLVETRRLDTVDRPLRDALAGQPVIVSKTDFVHRWSSMRGQVREDLLSRVSSGARAILEFGCGEGTLGAALKARQKCRVVGIEIDRAAAAVARKRLDDVYCGDVNEVVGIIKEKFDSFIGGDIVEHLADPWGFLADLRGLAVPGGQLLLSLPNIANASIIGDLLHGRFDYVYMGLTCAGHLRFFTRRSIDDMLKITGWETVAIEPQRLPLPREAESLVDALRSGGIEFSADDIIPSGFYVIARNPL